MANAIKTCALIFVLSMFTLAPRPAEGGSTTQPAPKQFIGKMTMTGVKDGKPTTFAEPTLVVVDGQEGRFLAGGEVPVDPATKETMSYGIQARLKVHQIALDQLRVSLAFNVGDLDAKDKTGLVIRDSGIRLVKEIRVGEPFSIDLDNQRSVKVTLTEKN